MDTRAPHATVLIATYNRAAMLDETLTWLARMRVSPALRWDALVVDNNSSDHTHAIVERHQSSFPVPLRYCFEGRQGRSNALNTGIATARGAILVFTDDDVRVVDGWLDAAVEPLLRAEPLLKAEPLLQGDSTIGYTGGPVRPLWGAPPPRWLDLARGDLWGTIAIQHHGEEPFVYEAGGRVPLGANMAVRREVFDRVGGFRADLGRTGGRLVLGQEVPELLLRARAAGFRGQYVPAMRVHHHIPANRLTPSYFRRWWFGKGVSRAALDRLQPITEHGIDLRSTPHVFRVPRFLYGSAVRDVAAMVRERFRGERAAAFRHQMMAAYFAGYCWARWQERRTVRWSAPQPAAQRTSNVVTTGR
jgi:glycosyltransferase involved in cell wall biosynthesis